LTSEGIPGIVRQFIFEQIDSVEQLEVLLLLHSDRNKKWSVAEVMQTLKTNDTSVAKRLASLKAADLLEQCGTDPDLYRYSPKTPEIDSTINALEDAYKVMRHRIFELIFSPMKKARNFADAFIVRGPKSEE
jgi:hypothetical protein